MKCSHIASLLILLLPISGVAADNSCFYKIREGVLAHTITDSGPIYALPTFEEHSKNQDSFGNLQLRYEFNTRENGVVTAYVYTFKAGQPDSQSILSLELNKTIIDRNKVISEINSNASFAQDCSISGSNRTVKSYRNLGKRVEVTYESSGTGQSPRNYKTGISPQDYDLINKMSNLHSVTEFFQRKIPLNQALAFTTFRPDGPSHFRVKIKPLPQTRMLSPFTESPEPVNQIEFAYLDTTIVVRHSSGPTLGKTETQGGVYHSEDNNLPRTQWMTLVPYATETQDRPKVMGLTNQDLTADSLSLIITGKGTPPTLFNSKFYFPNSESSKEGDGWRIKVTSQSIQIRPNVVAWNAPVTQADRKYLASSRFIRFSAIEPWLAELRPKLQGSDRLKAARLIIQTIKDHISYDYEALNAGLVDERTAEDIIKSGKGVCQHFSVIFMTVARALGIPAREISGYYINENSVFPHSWVEVKINDSDWWPLDAQVISESLQGRNYLPLFESRVYEPGSDTASGKLKTQIHDNQIWRQWFNTDIKAIPASAGSTD